MIRPILIEVTLFLLPFALYALFLWVTKSGVMDAKSWPLRTIGWLTIAALLLTAVSFVFLGHFVGPPPGSIYVPAHVDESGNFVPGYFK